MQKCIYCSNKRIVLIDGICTSCLEIWINVRNLNKVGLEVLYDLLHKLYNSK